MRTQQYNNCLMHRFPFPELLVEQNSRKQQDLYNTGRNLGAERLSAASVHNLKYQIS
jgi:hypothetical protein